VPQIEVFLAHETRHLSTFAEILRAREISRCKRYWFCGVGGFALGLLTSFFGRSGIMACTAAVETVVTGNLIKQLVFLESQGDREAAAAAGGIAQGKGSPLFKPLGAVVAAATSFVIWLGPKL
jgi:ubiquinone biosynthesis monooxygenase Coq7